MDSLKTFQNTANGATFGSNTMEQTGYIFRVCGSELTTGWSANAILVDCKYFNDCPCHRMMDRLVEVNEPFQLQDGWRGFVKSIKGTHEGIMEELVLLETHGRGGRVFGARKAHTGDLLITGSGRHLYAYVVPKIYDGAAVRSGSMLFSVNCTAKRSFDVYLCFLQALFQTRTYKRYIGERLLTRSWYWDLFDFKIPSISEQRMKDLIGKGEEQREVVEELNARIKRARDIVSKMYFEELGMNPRTITRCGMINEMEINALIDSWSPTLLMGSRYASELYPCCSLADVVLQRREVAVDWMCNSILKNIRCDRNIINETYLEGLLICNFMPDEIRRFSGCACVGAYSPRQIRKVQIPLPPMSTQIKLADKTKSFINDAKMLSADIHAYKRLSKKASDLIDKEIFHAVA